MAHPSVDSPSQPARSAHASAALAHLKSALSISLFLRRSQRRLHPDATSSGKVIPEQHKFRTETWSRGKQSIASTQEKRVRSERRVPFSRDSLACDDMTADMTQPTPDSAARRRQKRRSSQDPFDAGEFDGEGQFSEDNEDGEEDTFNQIEQDEAAYFSHRGNSMDVKSHRSYVLHPHGLPRISWDAIQLILTAWVFVSTPFEVAFLELDSLTYQYFLDLDIFIDVMFVLGILLNFMTAVEYDGRLRFSVNSIARHYLYSWFFFDLCWAIPFYALTGKPHSRSVSSSQQSVTFPIGILASSWFPACRIFRMTRVFGMQRFRRRVEYRMHVSSSLSSLSDFLLIVLSLSHVMSCAFAYIAFSNPDDLEHAVVDGIIEDTSIVSQYLTALYWAMMTMTTVGYGDATLRTNLGRLTSIIAMAVGSGVFAYGISNVVDLVQQLSITESAHGHKMDQVNTFMNIRGLPRKLRDSIRANFLHLHRATRESKQQHMAVLEQMSSGMQQQVAECFCMAVMPHSMPALAGCNAGFIHELYLAMVIKCYLPGEDIIRQGEYTTELYFLVVGHVQVLVGPTKMAVLGGNSWFGEFAVMNPSQPRLATIQAMDFCETQCIDRQTVLKVLLRHPFMITSIKELSNLKLRKAVTLLDESSSKARTLLQAFAAVWHKEGPSGVLPAGTSLADFPLLQESPPAEPASVRFSSSQQLAVQLSNEPSSTTTPPAASATPRSKNARQSRLMTAAVVPAAKFLQTGRRSFTISAGLGASKERTTTPSHKKSMAPPSRVAVPGDSNARHHNHRTLTAAPPAIRRRPTVISIDTASPSHSVATPVRKNALSSPNTLPSFGGHSHQIDRLVALVDQVLQRQERLEIQVCRALVHMHPPDRNPAASADNYAATADNHVVSADSPAASADNPATSAVNHATSVEDHAAAADQHATAADPSAPSESPERYSSLQIALEHGQASDVPAASINTTTDPAAPPSIQTSPSSLPPVQSRRRQAS